MAKSDTLQIMPQVRFRMPGASLEGTNDPNKWWADKFPEQTAQYGPAFMEGTFTDADGLKRWLPAHMNEDVFAAILGGDQRLGHRVVYCPHEETFYFYDYRVDAFCPTTEEKLKLLLSNYLIRCSQDCGALVDITNLVVQFRKPDALSSVIEKAKAVLEADKSFFEGEDGHKRMIDGKILDPSDPPPHELFIKHSIVPEPTGTITLTDCYHKYYRWCRDIGTIPPTRVEFQSIVADAIRSAFNIGLRHDVPGPNGKQANGWIGIAYRQDEPLLAAGRN